MSLSDNNTNRQGCEPSHVRPPTERRVAPKDTVVLPPVGGKQRTSFSMPRVPSSELPVDAVAVPSLAHDESQSLFSLESEEDEMDNDQELFPFLKRQSLTDVPSSSASVSLHHFPHQPQSSAKELTRALLNTRFHARRLHTPLWEAASGDHDCPIGRDSAVSHQSSGPQGCLSVSHSADSFDDTPARPTSSQITSEFADYIQKHLLDVKERKQTQISFRTSKKSPSCSSGSGRASCSIQWSAFEFREDDPPTVDNPFTRWGVFAATPSSPVLSSASSVSRHNLSSETDGLSESSRPVSDNPLTRLGSGDTASFAPLTVPLLPGTRHHGGGLGSIIVPPSRKESDEVAHLVTSPLIDDALPTPLRSESHGARNDAGVSLQLTLQAGPHSLLPSSPLTQSEGSALTLAGVPDQSYMPVVAMSRSAPAVVHALDNDALELDSSLPTVPQGVLSEALSATEVQYTRPVSPSGRRAVDRYSRTFSRTVMAQPGIGYSDSLTVPPVYSAPPNKITSSAPTVPLAFPSNAGRRPILSAKLAHRSQLARRALEDNELFFQLWTQNTEGIAKDVITPHESTAQNLVNSRAE